MPGEFLDSNILVYAFAADPRAAIAQRLLERDFAISVQGLNEFANIARRKLGMNWAEIREALAAIRSLCSTVLALDIEVHNTALDIAGHYGYGVFDALIVAAALRGDCDTLWSEDMQDGMVIDGRLRIINPFRAQQG
jgi:predicted nucleic acid-binding protein